MVQLSYPCLTTGKTIALTRWTFVIRVMSLLFNMLSRLVIAKEQTCFNFMASVTVHCDFGARDNKVCQFPICPHLFAMKWWNQMPWSLCFECWVVSQHFHSPLSPSSRGPLVPLCFLTGAYFLFWLYREVAGKGKSHQGSFFKPSGSTWPLPPWLFTLLTLCVSPSWALIS